MDYLHISLSVCLSVSQWGKILEHFQKLWKNRFRECSMSRSWFCSNNACFLCRFVPLSSRDFEIYWQKDLVLSLAFILLQKIQTELRNCRLVYLYSTILKTSIYDAKYVIHLQKLTLKCFKILKDFNKQMTNETTNRQSDL